MSTLGSRGTGVGLFHPAAKRIVTIVLLMGGVLSMLAATTGAKCVLVRERQSPEYTPHISVHFGMAEDVPSHIQCSTSIEKRSGFWCVPIYAWNLWDDVTQIEISICTPIAPTGFDRGPQISGVQMDITTDGTSTTTSFRLSSPQPLCGPALLGCLRLDVTQLPAAFDIQIAEHQLTARRAALTAAGEWRSFAVRGDAEIGSNLQCSNDACAINRPVMDLSLRNDDRPGLVELSWTPGSGSFTLIRYRTDGQYPSDPWDGELLAFLPSSISQFDKMFETSGDVHIAAWSITRGLQGHLLESSNMECGSVASLTVHQPIAVEQIHWSQVKTLYR
jgi:hypothetical protein